MTKPKYKEISYHGEFGTEIMFALPFAYWHYKNKTLKSTKSSKFTKELYFFSENHEECFDKRNNEGNKNAEIPRILFSQDYDISKWERVPLKEKYANDIFVFEKPILIIANKYNSEWGGPPISFFSTELLSFIIDNLKDKYTIIYSRPQPQNITIDENDTYELFDLEFLSSNYPEVIHLDDLYSKNKSKVNNFNHLQLMVYANADRFISIHGGTASFASYFGGINLILSKQGVEHYFGCFHKLFPQLSGARILHAKTDDEVKKYVTEYFVNG
ncbi:hypothetical protein [Mucilaginibacter sp.]|uniref:hypothetical protein n=1 Tax=Mucilaginibacter sp. TaxID=1882438 RepID=UPI00356AEE72